MRLAHRLSPRSLDVIEIFRQLNEKRGITVAFVTHEPEVAAHTRRIVSFRDGKIVSDVPNTPVISGVAHGAVSQDGAVQQPVAPPLTLEGEAHAV